MQFVYLRLSVCVWFLLVSTTLLPVHLTYFLNRPLPCDKDNSQV